MVPRSLRFLAIVVVLCSSLFFLPSHALAQHDCQFASEEAANKLETALEHAKSCKEAADLFNDCRWGSSADASFGATAVARCEKEFYKQLTTTQKNNYIDEMQLCAYQQARQQGTISISEAALCQVDLAASIAADRHVADKPVPLASFDCARAESPLEKAICSDMSLGRADVLLGRIYEQDLKLLKAEDRPIFIGNERKWLKEVPRQCGLDGAAPSRRVLNCLRNAFEIRFSSLDACGDESPSACLNPDSNPEDYGGAQADDGAAPRASFDCNSPNTALQVVICDDHELGQKDIEVAHAFDAAVSSADAATRRALGDSQRKWLQFVRSNCPLGVVGGIPNIITRGCIRSAYEVRAKQIDTCSHKTEKELAACLDDFKLMEK
jgi:uncharacterized protein